MRGKYGKNEWKIRMFSVIRLLMILAVVAALCAAGFLFIQKKQAEAKKEEQTKTEEIQKEPEPSEDAEPVNEEPVPTEPVAEEPAEEEKEEDQPAPVSMEAVSSVSATSALSEYDMTHSPDRIRDHDVSTAWVEGVSGNGEGESVVFMLNGTYRVSGFKIHAGYQKNSDLYSKNSRPAQIELSFSNGEAAVFDLTDEQVEQTFSLQTPADTTSVTLKILSVYGGWKYTDTAISEITFY